MSAPAYDPARDLIDQLIGLQADDPLYAVRRHREKVAAATQGSYDVLFDPARTDLSLAERLLVACYAARLTPAAQLLDHYHGLHLAVLKVLYVQKNRKNTSTNFDRHRTDRTKEPLSDSHDDDTEECEDTEDEIQNENNCDSGDSDIETVETFCWQYFKNR